MVKNRISIKRLCYDAVFAAICAVLSIYSISVGNIMKLTFAAFPIILAGFLYGPIDGLLVGMIGAFIEQMIHFGPGPTTILWMLPAMIRGVLVGFVGMKTHYNPSKKVIVITVLLTSILTTILNTGVMYLDALIFDYAYNAFTIYLLYRFLSGIIVGILYCFLVPIVLKAINSTKNEENA